MLRCSKYSKAYQPDMLLATNSSHQLSNLRDNIKLITFGNKVRPLHENEHVKVSELVSILLLIFKGERKCTQILNFSLIQKVWNAYNGTQT
jgi:hypothetical protein